MKENSIKEDIERLESIIKINNDYLKGVENQTINQKEIKALERVLLDYKRVLKENEELKNDNKYLRERETYLEKRRENIINFFQNQQTATTIPIQKIKDKIRKNEEIIDISNDGDLIHKLLQKNKVYEELLESEE